MRTFIKTIIFSLVGLCSMMVSSCVGEHTEYADSGNKEGLVLSVNKNAISTDDLEGITFKVTYNGEDVTKDAIIYNVTDDLFSKIGASFTSRRPGTYDFMAEYGDQMILSNKVTVKVVNNNGETGNYYRRILVADYTGTWCAYCYQMVPAINQAITEIPNRVEVMAIHVGDEYSIGGEESLEQTFGITGLPSVMVDNRDKVINSGAKLGITTAIKRSLKDYPAACGISIDCSNVADKNLAAKVNVDYAENGEYRIAAVLLEDGIIGTQASVSGKYTHNNTVRQYAIGTKKLGDDVKSNTNASTQIKGGESVESTFNFVLDNTWNAENCKVLIFVSRKEVDGNFYVNNVRSCSLGKAVKADFELE